MIDVSSVDDWLSAAVTSTDELATVALGFDGTEYKGKRETLDDGLKTSVVAIVSDDVAVQLAISASVEGCQQLARALLAMEPDEEDLPEEDVADAVNEAINILAGQVKQTMSEADANMKLGIPLFVHGKIEFAEDTEKVIGDVQLGPVPVSISILKSHPESGNN